MRHLVLTFFAVFVVFGLMACVPDDRLDLSASEEVSAPIRLDAAALEAKMIADETFALIISSELCGTCLDFSPLLKEIISDRQILVYEVIQEEGFPTDNPLVPYQSTPTFVLFENGEIISKIDPVLNPTTFDTVWDFERYLKEWIILN